MNFFSSDIKGLNKTMGRAFTNFDPVIGSESCFRSHRHEVFILKKSEINEKFIFKRVFAYHNSMIYLG